jgi:uncharacterized protein
MSIQVIYHAGCSDGFASCYLLWKKFKDEATYIPFHYGVNLDYSTFSADDIVYIVDFSFKKPVLLELANRVKKIIVLDHHKTAAEELVPPFPHNIFCTFDMTKSGAMLTWEYLHSDVAEPPKLIQYVQDRDLWQFKLPDSKEICTVIQSIPFEFEAWDYLCGQLEDTEGINYLRLSGSAILLKLRQQIDTAVKHAALFKLGTNGKYKVWAVNSTVNFSEVAGELATRDDCDFGVAWFMRMGNVIGKGKIIYQYSLRSSNGFDVSVAAKEYGGGGHPAAAGFESEQFLLELIN